MENGPFIDGLWMFVVFDGDLPIKNMVIFHRYAKEP
jgi:hypothetical protein